MNYALNIATMLHDSSVNGPGLRDVIWVQGCALHCKGCFNQHLWSFEPRYIIPVEGLVEKFKTRVGHIEGISILGGEPMHQAAALALFLEEMQKLGLTTVVYSGFTYEFLTSQENQNIDQALAKTDILIDGPFMEQHKDTSLIWRGSNNQRILFLSKTYNNYCIPEKEKYYHVEIHLNNEPSENGDPRRVLTGIR